MTDLFELITLITLQDQRPYIVIFLDRLISNRRQNYSILKKWVPFRSVKCVNRRNFSLFFRYWVNKKQRDVSSGCFQSISLYHEKFLEPWCLGSGYLRFTEVFIDKGYANRGY